MRLYDFPFAPNPRKVRVYLAEKGIEVPRVEVNLLEGEHRKREFLALNPMAGVPVLELDDGTVLRESLAIIEYFEELHPEPPMIGTTALERARVRAIERTCELDVLRRVALVFHATRPVLPGKKPSAEIARVMQAELPRPLAFLDEQMGNREFVVGERPTIADCTLFAAFEMARAGEIPLDVGLNLARWYESFRGRPSASA